MVRVVSLGKAALGSGTNWMNLPLVFMENEIAPIEIESGKNGVQSITFFICAAKFAGTETSQNLK